MGKYNLIMPELTPQDFVSNWKRVTAREKQTYQEHFIDFSNQRPTWLELVYKKLDEAVFAANGWPSDLSDEEILERLLSLNLERKSRYG